MTRFGKQNLKQAAGPRLRCFFVCVLLISVFSFGTVAWGQVDCVQNHRLTVREIMGKVVDPFGTAIPGATIEAVGGNDYRFTTKTDKNGEFALPASPGKYKLAVKLRMFQSAKVDLVVNHNILKARHGKLYVILGLAGSYCPWITTSKKELEYSIHSNEKRAKETLK